MAAAGTGRNRLWVMATLFLVIGAMLVGHWHNIQVSRFRHYAELAYENQLAVLAVEPPRGEIVDRHGEKLAINETVYSLSVSSDFANTLLGRIDVLRRVVDISERTVAKLAELRDSDVYQGVVVLREKLSDEEVARFLGWRFLFPEIILDAVLVRRYPFGDSAGHVIGYVGRLSDSDVQKLQKDNLVDNYQGARFIGKTGVESEYEHVLRGGLGVQQAQVDAHGRIFSRTMQQEPDPGDDIELTLDMRWQRMAEELLDGGRGAAVMMDVHNGELIILASSPRFDINHFVFGITPSRWQALNNSESKPLIHRAIYGQYAPGSTIKPFLALSALQRGWRDQSYQYHSKGYFQLGSSVRFHDWKRGGHGQVDIYKSIVRSVNSFYYQLGYEVGIDAFHDALHPFGFGAISGIDLDNEKDGVLPSADWKLKLFKQPWVPGDTISASVGQGYFQVTPLQMAVAMSMLANGGRRVVPHVYRQRDVEAMEFEFDEHDLKLIQTALADVTRPGGTAPNVGRGAPYRIAGKTGTAQVTKLRFDSEGKRIKNEDLEQQLRDHAWFVGYAPANNPQVAVAVIVENGGSGGKVAGPIARQLFDSYLIRGEKLTLTTANANFNESEELIREVVTESNEESLADSAEESASASTDAAVDIDDTAEVEQNEADAQDADIIESAADPAQESASESTTESTSPDVDSPLSEVQFNASEEQ